MTHLKLADFVISVLVVAGSQASEGNETETFELCARSNQSWKGFGNFRECVFDCQLECIRSLPEASSPQRFCSNRAYISLDKLGSGCKKGATKTAARNG